MEAAEVALFFGPSKAYTGATAVLVDELDPCAFQSLAKRGFVRERYWNFPVNDFHPANCCNADLRDFGSTPWKLGMGLSH